MSHQLKEPAATIRVNRAFRRLFRLAAGWYIVGLYFFLVKANFDVKSDWDKSYYVWRAASDLALIVALFLIRFNDRHYLVPLIITLTVRLCIEVATIFTAMKANDPTMVFILWLTLTLALLDQLAREIILRK